MGHSKISYAIERRSESGYHFDEPPIDLVVNVETLHDESWQRLRRACRRTKFGLGWAEVREKKNESRVASF